MNFSDITSLAQWWTVFFIIGLIFLPLTNLVFSNFFDKGYIFSKIIGIAFISYIVFLLGILKILSFDLLTIGIVFIVFSAINIFLFVKVQPLSRLHLKANWKIFVFEEILFILTLFFWSFIRAHQPDIHGLEKYMDFGFINSILRSEYFPPRDMWFTPLPINYYYFGHLVTAVLTKLSTIPSSITYNLMLSTMFAFTFTCAFSIGLNLFNVFLTTTETQKNKFSVTRIFSASVIAGLLSGFLISLAGNIHAIYTFFKPYVNENPVPFWQLAFSSSTFPNSYWYPNATRFIHNTIHEFPIYSSVVSDLHGHYLDVPFVLLTIAVLLSLILNFANKNALIQNSKLKTQNHNSKLKIFNLNSFPICDLRFAILLGFILAVMYMTNAWDGIIYLLLTTFVIGFVIVNTTNTTNVKYYKYLNIGLLVVLVCIGSILFSLPFSLYFKPFASGIGILCAPEFLTNIEKLGPFLFEKDHCQHSPWWQLAILYGFFYFWAVSFLLFILKRKQAIQNSKRFGNSNFGHWNLFRNWKLEIRNLYAPDFFVLLLIVFSTLLITIPEFIYVKDIYPGHYRANTMFKLVYQSFIMLSLCVGYIIVRLFLNHKSSIINRKFLHWKFVYWIIGSIGLFLVFLYPYFAINAYYNGLKTYSGLDGTKYFKTLYPTDYEAIVSINKNIKGQPVILEAQGDSYTDYARISTHTGLPTILGWTVHEWLWRGSYDIPSPRIEEVKKMYESENIEETKTLLKKHNVSLVFIGDLEKQKYPNLKEEKFKTLGKVIYQTGNTKIYQINN